jgi:DNA processing protein
MHAPCLSVVGSRQMSEYGRWAVRAFIPPIVAAGYTVVSGLAYGVDSLAHTVTLEERGTTIAVLGSGFQQIYPREHQPLARRIVEEGGLVVTQFPAWTPPRAAHFPERNRIIAGLSRLTLVIEAGERSGSLITARHAVEYGRDVCCIPGDITRPTSRGVNWLLADGAMPLQSPEQLLAILSSY